VTATSVVRAARAEKRAENDRTAADAAWRAAWWKTTMALAKLPATPRTELSQALREVDAVLGQSTAWLSKRRATGKAFVVLKDNELSTLPPRKAIEVVVAKVPVTDEVVEMLRESERNEETLRDFSARLTGTSWSVGSDEEIEKALVSKPELARKIARKVIESDQEIAETAVETLAQSQPEAVGRAVAKNPKATASYAEVRREETEEKRERLGVKPTEPTPATQAMSAKVAARNAVGDWMNLIHEASAKLHAAMKQWEEIEPDLINEDLVEVNASLVEAEGDAVILRQRVADQQEALKSTA